MRTLLVVDDDRDVTDVLRDEGYQVEVGRNGEEALRFVDERMPHMPDAVLLDVEMPVLDGPSMAYRLFVANVGRESIPIVLLAGVANLSKIAALVGTPYFLEKPFTLGKLLALVEKALSEHIPPHPSNRLAIGSRELRRPDAQLTSGGAEANWGA